MLSRLRSHPAELDVPRRRGSADRSCNRGSTAAPAWSSLPRPPESLRPLRTTSIQDRCGFQVVVPDVVVRRLEVPSSTCRFPRRAQQACSRTDSRPCGLPRNSHTVAHPSGRNTRPRSASTVMCPTRCAPRPILPALAFPRFVASLLPGRGTRCWNVQTSWPVRAFHARTSPDAGSAAPGHANR